MQSSRDTILESLRWRYAVKTFDASKKIPESDWARLEQALQLSPSAYGLQPWQFLVIQDQKLRRALATASWGQPQVEAASHLVVFSARTSIDEPYIDELVSEMARIRSVEKETLQGFHDMVASDLVRGPKSGFVSEWAARQAYLALGVLLTAAASLRIDACPMEGIEPGAYDSILGLESSGYRTLLACALGYRSPDDKYATLPKVRFAKEKVMRFV